MRQNIITFEDKVALNENADIPAINKVRDVDINEIKSIVNDSLQGTNAMGSIVVDNVTHLNQFDKGTLEIGKIWNGSTNSKAARWYISLDGIDTYSVILKNFTNIDGAAIIEVSELNNSQANTYLVAYSNTFAIQRKKQSNSNYLIVQISSQQTMTQQIVDALDIEINIGQKQNEIYSTEEEIIGTWIDGSTLYRKTFQTSNITTSNTNFIDISDLSVAIPVKLYGTLFSSTGGKYSMPMYDSSSNYSVIVVSGNYIRGRALIGDGGTLSTAYVTLEYTKTTD